MRKMPFARIRMSKREIGIHLVILSMLTGCEGGIEPVHDVHQSLASTLVGRRQIEPRH